MKKLIATSLSFVIAAGAFAQISYWDFSSAAGLQLNGTATVFGTAIRLTDTGGGNGTIFYSTPVDALGGFTTTWNSRHFDGSGADGISFVLTNSANTSIGDPGSGNATQSIPSSVSFNFQTFWKEIYLQTTDGSGVRTDTLLATGFEGRDPNGFTGEISYDGAGNWVGKQNGTTLFTVFFDPNTILSGPVNVGFGASTGAANDNNDLRSWNYSPVPEPATVAVIGVGLAGLFFRRRKL
jgi:hypothetical protein